jgi:hypothetical protein
MRMFLLCILACAACVGTGPVGSAHTDLNQCQDDTCPPPDTHGPAACPTGSSGPYGTQFNCDVKVGDTTYHIPAGCAACAGSTNCTIVASTQRVCQGAGQTCAWSCSGGLGCQYGNGGYSCENSLHACNTTVQF